MTKIDEIISRLQPISLAQMEGVTLMNRTDKKYWFRRESLVELLFDIADDYYILEIDGNRNMPYATTYYDTVQDGMYGNHHRGKMNRYKIRRRNYISTNSSFLEIKFKTNKGRTIKRRLSSDFSNVGFSTTDQLFITKNSPYSYDELSRVLDVSFSRMMLVSKAMNERCTIDSGLRFISANGEIALEDLTVVEVKRDGRTPSAIINSLNRLRLKPAGFSKYCIGRSLTSHSLKQNNFKQKHRYINKILTNLKDNKSVLWSGLRA